MTTFGLYDILSIWVDGQRVSVEAEMVRIMLPL
jgi:hypothetical protein